MSAGTNINFRPDHSWIKPRQESFDAVENESLLLSGDIAGEEASTDPPLLSLSSDASSSDSDSEEGEAVVMRGDRFSDSLPRSGTVKRHSDRLEGLCDAGNGATATGADVYAKEDIRLMPGIVKKTKQTIEARQRVSGEFCAAPGSTPDAPSRHFSGESHQRAGRGSVRLLCGRLTPPLLLDVLWWFAEFQSSCSDFGNVRTLHTHGM